MAKAVASQLGLAAESPIEFASKFQTPDEELLLKTSPKFLSHTIQPRKPAPASDLPLSRKQSMIMADQSA